MEDWDFKSLKTGKEFKHVTKEERRKGGHYGGDHIVTFEQYDTSADAYFVRLVGGRRFANLDITLSVIYTKKINEFTSERKEEFIKNRNDYKDYIKGKPLADRFHEQLNKDNIAENYRSILTNEFAKQLNRNKIEDGYIDILIKDSIEREKEKTNKELREIEKFVMFITTEFDFYKHINPNQPRFAVYSEEIEDLEECMKKGSIKSVIEGSVESVLHSKISVKPKQLKDIFNFTYTRMPLLNELEKELDDEVTLEFIHFSELDTYFAKNK